MLITLGSCGGIWFAPRCLGVAWEAPAFRRGRSHQTGSEFKRAVRDSLRRLLGINFEMSLDTHFDVHPVRELTPDGD